jgi:hypothetical protein
MLSLFSTNSINRVSFEDVQYAILHPENFIIVNTLVTTEQDCLIKNTLDYNEEESIINQLLLNYEYKSKHIIIYGKNCNDVTSEKKYYQILKFGFKYVYLYPGGLFEWLTLQDIYGNDEFPTTTNIIDILKYKPNRSFTGRIK